MKRTEETNHGSAYHAVKHVFDNSPGKSWRRLNGALQHALDSAIIGHLSFEPDDFSAIARETNGGYWMGNGAGVLGERYYGLSVSVGHTPACMSFERYAGRPAALWPEKVKTPERLCIGSTFTWEGQRLTVTNMMKDKLIACSYGERAEEPHVYMDGDYRRIDHQAQLSDGCMAVRLSPPLKSPDRNPVKILKIKYADMAAVRKQADAKRRDILLAISRTDNVEALADLTQNILNTPRGALRHFDIEDIRKSLRLKESELGQALSDAQSISRWLAGGKLMRPLQQVRLRINGEYVETSTGQSVSLEGVRRALPIVLKHRGRTISPPDIVVDTHTVNRISESGVRVGCTLVPWLEVDRLAEELVCGLEPLVPTGDEILPAAINDAPDNSH